MEPVAEVQAEPEVVETAPAVESSTSSTMPAFVELALEDDEVKDASSENIVSPETVPTLAPAASDTASIVSDTTPVVASTDTAATTPETTSVEAKVESTDQPSLIDFAAEPLPTISSEPVVQSVVDTGVQQTVVPLPDANETVQPISEIAEVNINSQGMLSTEPVAAPVMSNVPAPAAVLDLTDDDDDGTSGFEPDFS